ncbi:ABC transporter ATP-binding protein [Ferruginibacter sp. SUN002]|uniref:ABC transporter ATP-binding protein n=1 Tax=Ferruginibacter sp. SUN002 TaxID=2937789 RepID=UPI003D36DB05
MQIQLTNTGKRFNREWIFRQINLQFDLGKKYAITGPNGSGKSTLLQVISGAVSYNQGKIQYSLNGKIIATAEEYNYVSIAAPYLELIEEMTAVEFLKFHHSFKQLSLNEIAILEIIGLKHAANKQIRYFSSGMKQRLKLAQAFFTKAPILLLDEPTTNLDAEGISLYRSLIDNYTTDKLVIISSNDKHEYDFCDEVINISNYKQ